jgi:hypothetical protein
MSISNQQTSMKITKEHFDKIFNNKEGCEEDSLICVKDKKGKKTYIHKNQLEKFQDKIKNGTLSIIIRNCSDSG